LLLSHAISPAWDNFYTQFKYLFSGYFIISHKQLPMSFNRLFSLFISILFLSVSSLAQSPKREFRGAWIATVSNIDWPSRPGLPPVEQQREFVQLLDKLKAVGCNAVMVQVRPAADAFYPSTLEPWSRFLTGRQGQPPFPYYDPLLFMLEETHKRNMEFHAWFNPFRALTDSKQNPNPPGHVTRRHPDWIIAYGGKSYIDPGLPEAREYVIDVIADVVKRYDIDAVHLDDYFYPYRIAGKQFGDDRSYNKYGEGTSRDDWRRNNVSMFISLLNNTIKRIKPHMKLGVSPFGIWRNKTQDPEGSPTKGGQTNYDDLYADVLMWMQKGWVDYLMPQLYWEHTSHAAPFSVLMPWWLNHCYQRHVYYGLGLYRMLTARSGPWTSPNELLWQLRDIRGLCPNSGFAFFSASNFDNIKASIRDSLQYSYDKYPALVPPMPWLDSTEPAPPVLSARHTDGGTQLKWHVSNPQKHLLRYVVYRFINNEPIDLERSDRIVSIQQGDEFIDQDAKHFRQCAYVVTALTRMWNESKPSNKVIP
jgi:uncharacterized lipoprotein YddW (UPF0748 family)